MPVLHGYKNSPGKFYVKTAIDRRPLTVQLRQQAIDCLTGNRSDWSPSSPKYGLKDGDRFDQSLLVFLFRKGWAFTRGAGPGDAMSSWRLVFGDLPGKMVVPRISDVIEVEEGEDLPSTLRNTARLQFWLRIRCEGADCGVLDPHLVKFVDLLSEYGATVHGPIPLPTRIEKYRTTSQHGSRSHEIITHKRLVTIVSPAPGLMAKIASEQFPPGVSVVIKEIAVHIDEG